MIDDAHRTLSSAATSAAAIENGELRSTVLNEVALAQTDAGLFQDALETANGISERVFLSDALAAIASAQAAAAATTLAKP